jgi:endonuclease/exonuclease/phosphatase family metal-dependent hydrolase
MPDALSIVTLNLLADRRSWPAREALVLAELRALAPDVIALKEVDVGLANAHRLADALGGYSVHAVAANTGWPGHYHGLAILSRRPVLGQEVCDLGSQWRRALAVDVALGTGTVRVITTHLVWSPWDGARQRQVARLLAWLPPDLPVLLCGDLNAPPDFPSIGQLGTRLVSAHAAAHGGEPAWTYPTPLSLPGWKGGVTRELLLRAAGLCLWRRPVPWQGVLDYIFVDPLLAVHSCDVCFDRPPADAGGWWASDHLGLVACVGRRG